MADTKWRIAGGLGVPPEESVQHMTQGLGFPLRPVDGVPPPNTGDFFEAVPVAEGEFMQWMGPWRAGVIYPTGSVVTQNGWQMIANKATTQPAAPQPDGTAAWGMSDTPAWNDESELAVVYSGHLYEFNTGGWIKGLRVWVNDLSVSTNYRIIVLDITDPNNPKYTTIEEPVLNLDDWTILAAFESVVSPGTRLLVYLDALDSGGDTIVQGGWTYSGADNVAAPLTGAWNHTPQQAILRINKTDLDGTDRATELLGMTPDTEINFPETLDPNYAISYRTTSAGRDQGTYVDFDVLMTSTGPAGTPRAGNTTSMTAAVPIAQPTDYVELPGGVPTPSYATVTGYLQFNGEDQGGVAGNGYGVDLFFEGAVVSPDWDFMTYSGG